MSRRTWERHRNKANDANDANSCAPSLLKSEDRLASARPSERLFETKRKIKKRSHPSSRTATTLAADVIAANDPRMVARMSGGPR
jgi:hypothetical protein